jgi:outer membrane protein OmpA-like peptidoglycan-associated protein
LDQVNGLQVEAETMQDIRHIRAVGLFAAALLLAVAAVADADKSPVDVQEAGLRTSLAPTAALIARDGEALKVDYPIRLTFVPDGMELLPTGKQMLDILARSLRSHEHTQVVVAVYTDAIGGSEFNQQQSLARAEVVVGYLRDRSVAAARLVARGVGESAPLNAENTPAGRDLNRRLQVIITPLSS